MAPPELTSSTRYFDPEITKVYFVSTIADKSAPTRTEIDAGTDVSGEIAEIEGWQVTSNNIGTPDLGTRFTGSTPGRLTAEDSSLTFYADQGGQDVRTIMPRDTNGYILWMDGGDVQGNKMDVYPVRVSSNAKMRSLEDEASRIQVQFAITSAPAEDVDVPS